MSPEALVSLRKSAVETLEKVRHSELGIVACGPAESNGDPFVNRFHGSWFGRDGYLTTIGALSYSQGSLTPQIIDSAILHQQVAEGRIGQKDDPETSEVKGITPHEVLTKDSPQQRLVELEGTHPVKKNPDGTREMTTYVADDVNPLYRISVRSVAEAILAYYHNQDLVREYLNTRWPFVLGTIEHDLFRADLDGDGLIESRPKAVGTVNPAWKDSNDAYVDENGEIPKPPYKYLVNNCDFLASLRDGAFIAANLGYKDIAQDLFARYRAGLKALHEKFWMDDLQYFAPLIDGDGRQDKFIGDDTIDGVFFEVFSKSDAKRVLERLKEPDMLNDWGVRTRSSQSKQFGVNRYHRGTDWLHRLLMLAQGAENYGDLQFASELDMRAASLVSVRDIIELTGVAEDGKTLMDYTEGGKPVACRSQAWGAGMSLGRTARWLGGQRINGFGSQRLSLVSK